MFNPKDLYKIILKNQKYLENEYDKDWKKALKDIEEIFICPYHSIAYIEKKAIYNDFKMESMASMFPNCPICNPNGNGKANTQQTQNTSKESKPKQETKQAETTTKPHETPKPKAQPSQAEKQLKKVNNFCSFCPTDEEIKQENNKIQKNKQFYLQKLKLEQQDWKKDALDFEIYKQEVKNRGVLPNIPYNTGDFVCKRINDIFAMTNWICESFHLPCKITSKCNLDNNLSLRLFHHYAERSGRDLSIYEIGIANTLKSLINTKGALNKSSRYYYYYYNYLKNIFQNSNSSVQEKFLKDIVTGNIYFDNSYAMEKVVFALGGVTLRGIFDGSIKRIKECKKNLDCQKKKYLVQGNITYYFKDEFTDPYDIFQTLDFPKIVAISSIAKSTLKDFDGVPFAITGEFNVSINGIYDVNGVEMTHGF